jgi:polysaccharide biosynthesis transport protein
MNTIYEAYNKQVMGMPEMTERLHQVGSLRLYQPPHESQQEEFAKLSLRLLEMKCEDQGTVLAVASSMSGEGASFVSYSMATVLGLVYEQKVAWIDGNFRSPQKKLQGQDGSTFADLLRDPDLSSDLPCSPAHVTHVPGGTDLRSERARFTEKNYSDLISSLASRFDVVIIDLPPILETQDAALMARKTDGLLLVVAHRRLKRESIDSGVRSLKELGVNILGAVMNRRQFDLPGFLHNRI